MSDESTCANLHRCPPFARTVILACMNLNLSILAPPDALMNRCTDARSRGLEVQEHLLLLHSWHPDHHVPPTSNLPFILYFSRIPLNFLSLHHCHRQTCSKPSSLQHHLTLFESELLLSLITPCHTISSFSDLPRGARLSLLPSATWHRPPPSQKKRPEPIIRTSLKRASRKS